MSADFNELNWEPFSVPLEVAQKRIANWIDADPDEPIYPADMRAFVVRREDFVELLAQHDTEFVRLYVGRKEQEGDSGNGKLRPCLLLVSAAYRHDVYPDAPDPDTIIDLIGTMATGNGEATAGETYEVFDFSRPCPPDCDDDSPLFVNPAADCCD